MVAMKQKDGCFEHQMYTVSVISIRYRSGEEVSVGAYLFVPHMHGHEHTCIHLCSSIGFAERGENFVIINQKTMV